MQYSVREKKEKPNIKCRAHRCVYGSIRTNRVCNKEVTAIQTDKNKFKNKQLTSVMNVRERSQIFAWAQQQQQPQQQQQQQQL